MNVITFKRTLLAAVIGSSFAIGLGVPSPADAGQRTRDPQPRMQQDEQAKSDEQGKPNDVAKAARRSEREHQQEVRAQAVQAQADPRQGGPQRDAQQQSAQQPRPQAERQRQEAGWQRAEAQDPQDFRRQAERFQPRPMESRPVEPRQMQPRQIEPPRGAIHTAEAQARESDFHAMQEQRRAQRDDRDDAISVQAPVERRYQENNNRPERKRLSEPQRQTLINQQQQQAAQYSRQFESRNDDAERHAQTLQKQHRNSQYRYQQEYCKHLRHQQSRYNWKTYNYYNDPYFYAAPSYRYYRGGNYFNINYYGANLLQDAINIGYSEGLRAGRADRYDRWRYNYRDSYAYQDANYGYYGIYVRQSEYNYYFRQGFQRGYEDGYYSRRQYGRYYNGNDVLLATAMSLILNFRLFD